MINEHLISTNSNQTFPYHHKTYHHHSPSFCRHKCTMWTLPGPFTSPETHTQHSLDKHSHFPRKTHPLYSPRFCLMYTLRSCVIPLSQLFSYSLQVFHFRIRPRKYFFGLGNLLLAHGFLFRPKFSI